MSAPKFRGGGWNRASHSRRREGEGYIGSTLQTLPTHALVLIGDRPRGRGGVHVSPDISCLADQKDSGASNREFGMGTNERLTEKKNLIRYHLKQTVMLKMSDGH